MENNKEKYFSIFQLCQNKAQNLVKANNNNPTQSREVIIPESKEKMEEETLTIEIKKDSIIRKKVQKSNIKKQDYSKNDEANGNMEKALQVYRNRNIQKLLPNGQTNNIRNVSEYYGIPKSTLKKYRPLFYSKASSNGKKANIF